MFSKIFCDALHNLVLFVQFKKRGKHQWRSATVFQVLIATYFYDRTRKSSSWFIVSFLKSKFKICFNSMALNGGDVKTFTVNFLEKVKGLVEDERGSKIVKVYFKDRIS